MRKRELWVRKSQKRKCRKDDRGIVDLMRIMHHFFKSPKMDWEDERSSKLHFGRSTWLIAVDNLSISVKNCGLLPVLTKTGHDLVPWIVLFFTAE